MHVIGCTWFFIVDPEETDGPLPYIQWVPPLDFIYVSRGDYHRFYDHEEVDYWYQYLIVLYMAVLALGGNEMGPRTNQQIFIMFAILLCLILYNAIIFGEMTLLVGETTKKESEFQKEVDVANTAMKNMDLPYEAK